MTTINPFDCTSEDFPGARSASQENHERGAKSEAFCAVAIIGTAGGKGRVPNDVFPLMNANLFNKMVNWFKEHYDKNVNLVSGGAAWSDHVAVALFNEGYGSLSLHLPCPFNIDQLKFHDNGEMSWETNPGRLANDLHILFNKQIGRNSFEELALAISNGAHVEIHSGFHARNNAMKSDVLVAYSFSTTGIPESKGTLYTWNKSKALKKICVSLYEFCAKTPSGS